MVILDGIGDRGHECFDGKTPLYAAYTPNLDYLATIGMNGLYHSYIQGIPMSSETAHFLIFGYDLQDFPGRGYIEAIGEGIKVDDKDVAILCHLCSVDEKDNNLILRYGYPKIDEEQAIELKKVINTFEGNGIELNLIHSKGINGFIILKGNVSDQITDSDPIYEGMPVIEIMPLLSKRADNKAKKTSDLLNKYLKWCYQTLSNHFINKERLRKNLLPINALVTQRAGKKKKLQNFFEKWGLRALSISSGAIYQGLCMELGMDTIKVKDTSNIEEDLKNRLQLASEAYNYGFIHVHTKMPDEAGHTKNPWYKKDVIEAIDRAMSFAINAIISDSEVLLVITADHSTASKGVMIHTGETIPLTMVGKHVRRDEVRYFNEIACANGGLGLVKGKELMYLILNFLDKAKMQGLMDTPVDQPYYHGRYRPLKIS
ncbi:MAG: alkaline phosphatase family protein [Thermodesulfovibrionales bacterium]